MENDDITFVILEGEEDDFWGTVYNLYLENNTDSLLMYTMDDVTVNGQACDPYWACTVMPHTRAYSRIYYDDDDLAEVGVEKLEGIKSIGFTLRVYDDINWDQPDLLNDVFTYQP